MTALPRSLLLAAWSPALLASSPHVGRDPAEGRQRGLDAVQRGDEAHTVDAGQSSALGDSAPPSTLIDLLASLRAAGVSALRLVLPVPGDPTGLPGPAPVNHAAVAAGEALVAVAGPPVVLVPQITTFGPPGDQGHQVCWSVLDGQPAPPAPSDGIRGAERQLRTVLSQSADVLADLDAAPGTRPWAWPSAMSSRVSTTWSPTGSAARSPIRWSADSSTRLAGGRESTDAAQVARDRLAAIDLRELPSGLDPQAIRVADLALRIRGVAATAREQQSPTLSGWQTGRREDVLRRLDDAARRCLVAVVNDAIAVSVFRSPD
ncbi:MAG: hypothetical protein ACRC35_09065 [Angustibacter sp.]